MPRSTTSLERKRSLAAEGRNAASKHAPSIKLCARQPQNTKRSRRRWRATAAKSKHSWMPHRGKRTEHRFANQAPKTSPVVESTGPFWRNNKHVDRRVMLPTTPGAQAHLRSPRPGASCDGARPTNLTPRTVASATPTQAHRHVPAATHRTSD